MRRTIGLLLALAATLGACADAPQPLNSEGIAARFGSYGIEILAYDAEPGADAVRRASLYSTHDDARICRTYAVTRFNGAATGLVGDEHARILAGGSIGATFKANGWQVSKQTRYIGEIDAASVGRDLSSLMQLPGGRKLAMHVYRMWLKKPSQLIEYATIIEIHHPDYLGYPALAKRYPAATTALPDRGQMREWRALIAGGVQ